MIPGIGSYAFRWAISHPGLPDERRMGLYEFIDEVHRLSARSVQICDNLPFEKLNSLELKDFKAYTDRKGIRIELGMTGCQPERIVRMIDVCKILEASILRIVLGSLSDGAGSVSEYRELLEEPVRKAEAKGMVLAIENHFELSPDNLVRLVEGFGSPNLGMCLDSLNSVKFLAGYRETCRALSPLAVSVHVKDVRLNRFKDLVQDEDRYQLSASTKKEILDKFNTGFYISGCPLGKGVVDLPWMIREIARHGHDPDIFVESWMDPRPTLKETLAAEKDMVHHDFTQLQKLLNDKKPLTK